MTHFKISKIHLSTLDIHLQIYSFFIVLHLQNSVIGKNIVIDQNAQTKVNLGIMELAEMFQNMFLYLIS